MTDDARFGGEVEQEKTLEELINDLDADELRQRRKARSTTDKSERKRCPRCLCVSIRPQLQRKATDYYCRVCDHEFDEPEVREIPPESVGVDRLEQRGEGSA